MPKQIFVIIRPPESKPIDVKWLEKLLNRLRAESEWDIWEVETDRDGNPILSLKKK